MNGGGDRTEKNGCSRTNTPTFQAGFFVTAGSGEQVVPFYSHNASLYTLFLSYDFGGGSI